MTTTISGSYPAVNSDTDATINGLTVGKGAGSIATNTAVGKSALSTNTTGAYNTAVGGADNNSISALQTNSTGASNTAVGNGSLGYNTGSYNTAVGFQSANLNTSGGFLSGFGYVSLLNNTTGVRNSGLGAYTLSSNTTGGYNVAVGMQALSGNTTASNNVAVGYQAAYSNTIGFKQVAIGNQALYSSNTSGGNSWVAIGAEAAWSFNSSGSNQAQVYIGASAGYYNVTGIDNTYVGGYAGYYHTGGYNTALGSGALLGASGTSTGNSNTAIGYQAGKSITSGGQNSILGYASGAYVTTATNNVILGQYAGGLSGINGLLTTGDQNVLIGYGATTSSSSGTRQVVVGGDYSVGKGNTTTYFPEGPAYQGNNSAAWSVASDQRLKKNIVDNTIGLSAINGIQVRNFEYRLPEEVTDFPQNQAIEKTGVQLGVIAQELQQVLPDCVKTESTGIMSVDATNITWHLINAVKELSAKVTALEARGT